MVYYDVFKAREVVRVFLMALKAISILFYSELLNSFNYIHKSYVKIIVLISMISRLRWMLTTRREHTIIMNYCWSQTDRYASPTTEFYTEEESRFVKKIYSGSVNSFPLSVSHPMFKAVCLIQFFGFFNKISYFL